MFKKFQWHKSVIPQSNASGNEENPKDLGDEMETRSWMTSYDKNQGRSTSCT
ncbi:hypothetical protein M413DRAFT_437791 [Hebeloma cylindrosporum]|uniref:Uncharacterized protein n=1 Tax=Hebeloma cylindrosporum TaxID=76867 RepID=A0A0C3CIL9_HEBCY|nr:hypothetical protein M413DRAFT_437791 [Hebeloma cylindrosporum h7]